MFHHAIVRKPGRSIVFGLTSAKHGPPDYDLAIEQHAAYVTALENCGLEVKVLDAEEGFPDSTFVEDAALLCPDFAVLTNPGAPSRKGEVELIRPVIENYFDEIEFIRPPGTLEPGDVMMAGSHFYIGLSSRTNSNGARQLIAILEKHGLTGSTVELNKMLHLKTGLAYLEHNTLIACGEFVHLPVFQRFNIVPVDEDEAYAANCLWINNIVLVAAGYPKTAGKIKKAGYTIIELNMSEFHKVDGGLSCLSLRW